MSDASLLITTAMSYLYAVGTVEGFAVLDSVRSPYQFMNAYMGVDVPNRRATLVGTFTPTNAGKLDRVYFKILSPNGEIMSEIELIDLALSLNLYVQANVTYKVVVSVSW